MLQLKNLNKYYNNQKVLNNISFNLKNNQTLGVIGQNGAGKTTIFRLLLNFIEPDNGSIIWHQNNIDLHNQVGYLPEERGLTLNRTIEEQILYLGKLKNMSTNDILSEMEYWFDKFEVTANKKQKIESLSKGNQQKIQLICSIIHRPKLLILDEPYSGLDPVNSSLLSNGINELKNNGTTIIFSSHNIDNVESTCDELIMINKGNIVLNGAIDDIQKSFGSTNVFIENTKYNKDEISKLPGVLTIKEKKNNILKLHVSKPEIGKEIFKIVTKKGYTSLFKQSPPTLEEIFKMKVSEYNV